MNCLAAVTHAIQNFKKHVFQKEKPPVGRAAKRGSDACASVWPTPVASYEQGDEGPYEEHDEPPDDEADDYVPDCPFHEGAVVDRKADRHEERRAQSRDRDPSCSASTPNYSDSQDDCSGYTAHNHPNEKGG